ncbi:carbohydrate-binding module family 13 protein [Macrolepiota fuliginosa MF-IS2]|uniref:Carbohydrate-binding module family 13 protein n=1 Tax=Macrolepiota fuliginosa MF-IS2 TaxID=1400762 RepID=A0A9P5X7L1_9AGAR|nr:carbohydrate-binding module family 13 protein [Macrolepiota fuliginosa MF-IS2]KAF9445530.1 carbohydrate-binding module family 13 protein [Macrolepiota fuliginosa MF-IS2]
MRSASAIENGTAVQIFDCNGTPAQDWVVAPGEGHVNLASTGFCLDAGMVPANGIGMKIWECFNNLPAQDWFYTSDQRIALTNQGLCLDLTNGDLTNGNLVQTWTCTDFDTNQIWTIN